MTSRKIALVGYPAEYFLPFAKSMEQADFQVFWVCALRADVNYLLRNGVLASHILDINSNFQLGRISSAICKEELVRYENDVDPKVNDIILMDRLLCKKNWNFSLQYIGHVARSVAAFFSSNEISLVSSWRDTAVQLTSMLVARQQKIPFVIPTRLRIPQEVYGFCTAHHTESFLAFAKPTSSDLDWAEQFLSKFESRGVRPALKKATRNFIDVLRLMPAHFRAFMYELRRSFADIGNDYTRYPLGRLVSLYAKRRVYLLIYKLFNPCERDLQKNQQFCLYALQTQPESSIDVQGSYFSNQLELIRNIARSLPSDHLLYVKVHPTDVDGKSLSFYRQIKKIPSVVLVDHAVDSRTLLENASIVFALTGTIAYEAGLMQKPVIVFARNFFNALPTVHRCDAPAALPALIARLLGEDPQMKNGRAKIVSLLANLRASCFDGEVSRTYGASNEPLRPSDHAMLKIAYCKVYAAVTGEQRR